MGVGERSVVFYLLDTRSERDVNGGVGCVYLFESDLKSKNHVLNCDDILLGVRFDQSEYKVRKALK